MSAKERIQNLETNLLRARQEHAQLGALINKYEGAIELLTGLDQEGFTIEAPVADPAPLEAVKE